MKSFLAVFVGLIIAAVFIQIGLHFGAANTGVAIMTGISSGHLFNPVMPLVAFAVPAGIINSSDLKILYEERGKTWELMKGIDAKATEEKRALSDEEKAKWDAADADIQAIDGRITHVKRSKELEEIEARQREQHGSGKPVDQKSEEYRSVFAKFIKVGADGLSAEERQLLVESRAVAGQITTTDAQGGYLVPKEMSAEFEKALLAFGGMRVFGNPFPTAGGGTLNWPTVNDTSSKATIIGQLEASTAAQKSLGNVAFGGYTYRTPIIPVSLELLNDSMINIEQLLTELLSESIFRGSNEHFTTGDGTTQPQGVITGGTKGADGSVSAISFDNLIDLMHSVDPAYRASLKAAWLMNDNTLKLLKKLKDSNGQYIWQPSLRDGSPDMILGKPYVINQDMTDVGASAKSVAFGDGSKFKIREIGNLVIKRLDERYADQLAVGFIGFARYDSKLVDAGTHPIKYLQHAAS